MFNTTSALHTTTTIASCELTLYLMLFTPPPLTQPCVNWSCTRCSLHHHHSLMRTDLVLGALYTTTTALLWTDFVLGALYCYTTTTGTALCGLTSVLFTSPPQPCVNWPWSSLHHHQSLVCTDLGALYTTTTALCELTLVLFTPPWPCVNWPCT